MTWRSATPHDLSLAALWALAAGGAIAIAPLAPLFTPWLPACPLHTMTGIPCPTCGATRAALSLARGEWLAALTVNPLAAVGVPAAVLGGLLAPAWVVIGAPVPMAISSGRARLVLITALGANWIYLIARGV